MGIRAPIINGRVRYTGHTAIDRRILFCLFAALWLISAIAGSCFPQQDSVSAWDAAQFRTWSFIPYWTTQTQLESFAVDGMYDHVSDVLYFSGVRPTSSGDLNYHPRAAQHLATLADAAVASGFRLHMSMLDTYGGDIETVWNTIVANAAIRAHFVAEVTDLLQTYNMQGFNLDWERPNTVAEWANYTQLARDLKEAIGPLGMEVSIDDYGYTDSRWDDTDIFDARIYDQLFIMGYHFPAYSSDSLNNNFFADGKLALTGQGLEKAFTDEQLVLGIGTWGKPTVSGQPIKTLKAIVAADPDLAYVAGTWTDGTYTWTIESRAQVRDKVQLALDRNMAGIMNWTLHYDATNAFGLHRVAHHYTVFQRGVPDLNLDGRVSMVDAETLSDHMGTVPGWTGTNTPARFDTFYLQGNWELGDRDGNGFVNQADADWLAGRFDALGVQLPDRLAYTGTFESFQHGLGLIGRWRVAREGGGDLPETGNFTQHGAGYLTFSGSGPGAEKYSDMSVTLRNQNSAEAYDGINTEPRSMRVDLLDPIDLGQDAAHYFTFLVRQNTGPLLASQLASDDRDLYLQFLDAAGTNQFDISLSGKSGRVGINYREDPGGEAVSMAGFLPDSTYFLVGKISGSPTSGNQLQLAFFATGAAIADFTDPSFAWMLTAPGSPGYDSVITQVSIESLFEANYTVSNLQIGPAALFFDVLLPGDFDADGDVDGADFLTWQRGESAQPVSGSDLADWEANFGTVFRSIAADSAPVPEPSSWVMLLLGTWIIWPGVRSACGASGAGA